MTALSLYHMKRPIETILWPKESSMPKNLCSDKNIFIPPDGPISDGFNGFTDVIVCAETETAARKIHPDAKIKLNEAEDDWTFTNWDGTIAQGTWVDATEINSLLIVKFLGIADPSLPRGVVCASYRSA